MRDSKKKNLQFQAPEMLTREIAAIASEHHSSLAGAVLFIVEDWFRRVKNFDPNEEASAKALGANTDDDPTGEIFPAAVRRGQSPKADKKKAS